MTDCLFCKMINGDISPDTVYEDDDVLAFNDISPKAPTHILIIPKRHVTDYFSMSAVERDDATELIRVMKNEIQISTPEVNGFNIGMNCGEEAGQTVMHSHIHLIPRRKGDVPDPRGGVRGCIPGKMGIS